MSDLITNSVAVLQPLRFGYGLPPLEAFERARREGWISTQERVIAPGRTYRIYNYTRGCQWEGNWNDVTSISRGLIVCVETGEIVALPLLKFFNMGERLTNGAATMKGGPFTAKVKMDGSLGIAYRTLDAIAWSTRGSFGSPQSAAAQAMWNEKYSCFDPLFFGEWNHITPMAEIIHPIARVVVRYDFQDLVLIAARDRFTGVDMPQSFLEEMGKRIGMPVVESLDSSDLDAILARVATLDGNHEGFVLSWPDGYRLKVKGDEYKRLHRLMSGITPQHLAMCWFDGTWRDLLREMPEEFREESEVTLAELDSRAVVLAEEVEDVYRTAPQGLDRKQFAAWAKQQGNQITGFLCGRNVQEDASTPRILAKEAVTAAIASGRIYELLQPERHGALIDTLRSYEASTSAWLWDITRTVEGIAKIKVMLAKFPKKVRGAVNGASESLQPQLIVQKLRAYVQQPENRAAYAELDVDAMMAASPDFEDAIQKHIQWVMSQPIALRSFLDTYRRRGQSETAKLRARLMLASAVGNQVVPEFLRVLTGSDNEVLTTGLDALIGELEGLWKSLPHAEGPLKVLAFAGAHGEKEWLMVLLDKAHEAFRLKVRDAYIEEHKGETNRFDDEA